jgi:hypothetical protein
MATDGRIVNSHVWAQNDITANDSCRAVTDIEGGDLVFLLEVKSKELKRSVGSGTELMLVGMKPRGNIFGIYNINFGESNSDFMIGGHSFFIDGDKYYFGSHSQGFKTKHHTSSSDKSDFDTHLFKLNINKEIRGSDCFHSELITDKTFIKSAYTPYKSSAFNRVSTSAGWTVDTSNQTVTYSSKYSGSFNLLQTFKHPKMCSTASGTLKNEWVGEDFAIEYYRGQNEKDYSLSLYD